MIVQDFGCKHPRSHPYIHPCIQSYNPHADPLQTTHGRNGYDRIHSGTDFRG